MREDRTVKCPICGRPYKVIMFLDTDQSACHKCVREAAENSGINERGGWQRYK